MNEQKIFQELKLRILISYQKSYPYFQGEWKSFSSKDIRQLIDLIEEQLKEKVSEKWIYTHLKPEVNEKLPRKDMLDIFSKFVGFSSWEEFVFNHHPDTDISAKSKKIKITQKIKTPKFKKRVLLYLLIPILAFIIYEWSFKMNKKTLLIKNEFTKQPVKEEEVSVYQYHDEKKQKKKLDIINSKIELENNPDRIIIESPYYEAKEIQISQTRDEIYIKPEDYAVVLKTFIESDIQDWEKRKEKLDKILSEDLEVILFQKENLGAEHLNKKEFSEKLILPTSETKNFKIVELETNPEKQITFIRIQKI